MKALALTCLLLSAPAFGQALIQVPGSATKPTAATSGGASDGESVSQRMYRELFIRKKEALMNFTPRLGAPGLVTCISARQAFGFPDFIGEGLVNYNCFAGPNQRTINHVINYQAALSVSVPGCSDLTQIRSHFSNPAHRTPFGEQQYLEQCRVSLSPAAGQSMVQEVSRQQLVDQNFIQEALTQRPELKAHINNSTSVKVGPGAISGSQPGQAPLFSNPLGSSNSSGQ